MLLDEPVRLAAAHWGKVYGVTIDPALVHGILERESRHGQDPNYIRHGGVVPEPGGHVSYGPMQVYDTTLPELVNPGSGITGPDLARDPALGVWWGTKYFAKMLAHFHGDTVSAVAAYNAGPGNARRNAEGKFPNQAYVDAVLLLWQKYKVVVASILPMLAIAAIVLLFMARRGRVA